MSTRITKRRIIDMSFRYARLYWKKQLSGWSWNKLRTDSAMSQEQWDNLRVMDPAEYMYRRLMDVLEVAEAYDDQYRKQHGVLTPGAGSNIIAATPAMVVSMAMHCIWSANLKGVLNPNIHRQDLHGMMREKVLEEGGCGLVLMGASGVECSCSADDLMPCGQPGMSCEIAMAKECSGCEDPEWCEGIHLVPIEKAKGESDGSKERAN